MESLGSAGAQTEDLGPCVFACKQRHTPLYSYADTGEAGDGGFELMVNNPWYQDSPCYAMKFKMLVGLCPLLPFHWHSGGAIKRKKGANQYRFPSGTCRPLWIELVRVGGQDATIGRDFTTQSAARKFNRHFVAGATLIRDFPLGESTKKSDIVVGDFRERRLAPEPTPPSPPAIGGRKAKKQRISRANKRDAPDAK